MVAQTARVWNYCERISPVQGGREDVGGVKRV